MTSIRAAVVVAATVLLLASCGSDGSGGSGGSDQAADEAGDTPTTTATTPPPTADFELTTWRGTWEPAQSAYGDALGAFGAQVGYLLDNGASNRQIATAIARLSADVETAGRSLIKAMDGAEPIPEDRADVATATDALRAAVTAQVEAYAELADCGRNYDCQKKAFAAIEASSGGVEAALQAYPER